jgi:hypothetical protein
MMNHHVTALYKRRANRIEYHTMGHVTCSYTAANAAVSSTLWHAVPCCMRQVVNVNLWAGSAMRLALCTLRSLIWTWTKCNTFKFKLQSLLMPWRLEFSSLGCVTVHDLQNLTNCCLASSDASVLFESFCCEEADSGQEHCVLFSINSLPRFVCLFIYLAICCIYHTIFHFVMNQCF